MQPDLSAGCLLCFDDEQTIAQAVAAAAGLTLAVIQRHRFPDGELRLRLPESLPPRVVFWRGLHQPNEKLVEILLVARTAHQLGAVHLTLVAPYLAYMRQDIAFNPGEAVSQRVIGRFLAGLFDAVITVDPHLHRVATLEEAIPVKDAIVLSGAPLLADHIATQRPDVLLIGPDEESLQWVAQAAARHGWAHGVCRKLRHGDRQVDIELPDLPFTGRAVVLMDDVASSGHTLAQAARLLKAAGAASVDVAVTHALFADGAVRLIREAGAGQIWSTDSIPHASNAVSIVPAVAEALQHLADRTH
ncbi:MAG TPA: phosphoribosylpyrophosphate synthetase [Hydrogenophaga sp.]|uniref:ribose-phosphate diphosphokinase n=1 Tax=Hydrogenophaga sp. TaxID=1904254 RepID=UPI0008BD1EF1|nr:ribose-phosphate diphosphokinase [Hydrogenophaga sp.]MBU4184370.1 ribose-phosphate diphosphokinase [Gammaproteobacteria bacterium]OGA79488.1 MAG: phosphoribosylpyrophosphate synthetase [Burkholderiales bacterium GWE1_65_30]OGA92856.1 MAG: phosphoribosylpyrophosphate synthetase [Burkholderiales bacterium GWF1_66_17]OGB17580.1 MAG: phosphoribosylpyrophosphate synthetase [Burkholderiales bacterium RIFCSPHIGHO2_02_FULL_66_10]OGB27292.1 MAG: phosphoribosylpyrophosphate synthetase [Burkholderiale